MIGQVQVAKTAWLAGQSGYIFGPSATLQFWPQWALEVVR